MAAKARLPTSVIPQSKHPSTPNPSFLLYNPREVPPPYSSEILKLPVSSRLELGYYRPIRRPRHQENDLDAWLSSMSTKATRLGIRPPSKIKEEVVEFSRETLPARVPKAPEFPWLL